MSDEIWKYVHKNFIRPHLHYAGEIWKRRFHSENASNVFRPHYTGGIWKRRFHSENASNVFRARHAEEIWKRNNLAPGREITRLP